MSDAGVRKRGEKPGRVKRNSVEEAQRWEKVIHAQNQNLPAVLQPHVATAAPILAKVIAFAMMAFPYVLKALGYADHYYAQVPKRIVYAILGVLMCFFGGFFPATIAACEAWNLCGGREAVRDLRKLYREMVKVAEADDRDNQEDLDGDGIADVDQIAPDELLKRKGRLVLKTIDPTEVSVALEGLAQGWLGVLATLRVQFAQTVTLGNAIGDRLFEPANAYLTPVIMPLVHPDYEKWVPAVVRWVCKSIAVTIAWTITRVLAAFHSAIRGGFLAGTELCNYLEEQKMLPQGVDRELIQQAIGWGLAFMGLVYQFRMGFSLPFPLSLLLFPVQCVEWFIRYSIQSGSL